MGYSTDFQGHLEVHPPLSDSERRYLEAFSDTRRMRRERGPYFVGGTGMAGQGKDSDVLDYNSPDPEQPGLWCNLVPNADGTRLEWSGTEKTYGFEEWIEYIIDHFLKPDCIALQRSQTHNLLTGQTQETEQSTDLTDPDALPPELLGDRPMHFLQGNHTVSGIFHAYGEERSDLWTIVVNANQVTVLQGIQTPDLNTPVTIDG